MKTDFENRSINYVAQGNYQLPCVTAKEQNGAPENMPFDIASRRLTPFSLKDGKSKGEIKRYIKSVIQDTVENVLEKGKRVKSGFSNLRIGSYDNGVISDSLNPYEISKASLFIKHKEQILEECTVLLEQIKKIGIPKPSELHNVEKENDSSKDVLDIIREDGTVLTPIKNSFKLNLFKRHRVNIKDEDKKAIIDCQEKADRQLWHKDKLNNPCHISSACLQGRHSGHVPADACDRR